MAKAAPIPAMPADTPLGAYAAAVIEVRAGEVAALAGERPGEDPTALVHDRRVALRRLRTAIEVFAAALPGKGAKAVRRELKSVFAAMGARRDADVALETLSGIEPLLTAADRPGYKGLVDTLVREAPGAVDLDAMARAADRALDLAERARDAGGPPAGEALGKAVARRAREVAALAGGEPHELRLAAKRLRYVLQAGEPVLGAEAGVAADATRELQDVLGALQDVDVLLEHVRTHRRAVRRTDVAAARAGERLPGATHQRGLDAVEVHLRARRAALREQAAADVPSLTARIGEAARALRTPVAA